MNGSGEQHRAIVKILDIAHSARPNRDHDHNDQQTYDRNSTILFPQVSEIPEIIRYNGGTFIKIVNYLLQQSDRRDLNTTAPLQQFVVFDPIHPNNALVRGDLSFQLLL